MIPFSNADFGDTVDNNFACPAFTTCPVICVDNIDDCPVRGCPQDKPERCPNGRCRRSRLDCAFEKADDLCSVCGRQTCPKYDEYYDLCLREYRKYDTECKAQDSKPSFAASPLSVLGIWLIGVSVATFLWCRANHHPNATLVLEQEQTQTGYKESMIGQLLYYAVLLTLLGFQLLLLAFCWASYHDNEKESLRAFEVTWVIGFLWTLWLKWPFSIQSIFWQQCPLPQATRVCIFVPKQQHLRTNTGASKSFSSSSRLDHVLALFRAKVNATMSWLFASPARGFGSIHYVNVKMDGRRGAAHRYFVFQFRRYNFNEQEETFVPGRYQLVQTLGDLVTATALRGLSTEEVYRRLRVVGPNIIEAKHPKIRNCIYEEFSKPFYTYQAFILWTWVPLYYYYLAVVHGSVIIVGGFSVAIFRYRNESNLYELTHMEGTVNVLRDGGSISIVEHADLVPGDVVMVSPGKVHTDMILVQTEGLLVDESALTGESAPVAKTQIDPLDGNKTYNPLLHKKHTISAGTTVLESELENNLAVVLSTGSYTSKGKLLREVFSYERHQFKFDQQVPIVMAILFVESIAGFILACVLIQEQPVYAWFYGMYVVSTILPPLLPTAFTVSVGISDNRLAKKNIACSNSEDILVAGKVNKAFFDKTGTLTRQGLDFISARCASTWNSGESTDLSADMITGMACCHGLMRSSAGQIVGNHVDKTMFAASRASFAGMLGNATSIFDGMANELVVVKCFDFDHHRMTQGVIVKRSDGSLTCFVKGSGESLFRLCDPLTLPSDFEASVSDSAKLGTYQISMGCKHLSKDTDLNRLSRDEVESNLVFVGVINFKNVLRPESPEVIRHLEQGGVQCIMVTGDSVLTGITIAKEAGLIMPGTELLVCTHVSEYGEFHWVDESGMPATLPMLEQLATGSSSVELAVSGDVWEAYQKQDGAKASQLAKAIRVYGRCTPFHKVSVVSTFVDMGHITLMCGDGGNDCGALKTAHVGIALSDAEASLVSPFASLDKSITSVVDILREGRCALASALASYKYVVLYGQIEAFNNLNGAYFLINFSEYCWVFMDGFWLIAMGFSLPLAKAASQLVPAQPTASLLGPITMASACGVLFWHIFFAVLSVTILHQQDWFQCRKWTRGDVSNLSQIGDNYESETLFLVTGYQYISTAMAYNFGYEFRKNWFHNHFFVGFAIIFTILHFWITLVPGKFSCIFRVNCENEDIVFSIANGKEVPIQNPFNTTVMPVDYRITLIILMVVNSLVVICWDYFVVNGIRQRLGRKKREEETRFLVSQDLALSPNHEKAHHFEIGHIDDRADGII